MHACMRAGVGAPIVTRTNGSLSLGEPRTMVNGFTLPQDALPSNI